MNTKEACMLLEALMDGIDPTTGEVLPEDHVCQEPAVLRALHKALAALYRSELLPSDDAAPAKDASPRTKLARAGMPWTAEEDDKLHSMWKQGATKGQIARALQRSSLAIHRRLENLGMLADHEEEEVSLLPPWTLEDVRRLKEMHAKGCTVEEIAGAICQPAASIRARMFYMGLSRESPVTLPARNKP